MGCPIGIGGIVRPEQPKVVAILASLRYFRMGQFPSSRQVPVVIKHDKSVVFPSGEYGLHGIFSEETFVRGGGVLSKGCDCGRECCGDELIKDLDLVRESFISSLQRLSGESWDIQPGRSMVCESRHGEQIISCVCNFAGSIGGISHLAVGRNVYRVVGQQGESNSPLTASSASENNRTQEGNFVYW
jgi:hypothetical protein